MLPKFDTDWYLTFIQDAHTISIYLKSNKKSSCSWELVAVGFFQERKFTHVAVWAASVEAKRRAESAAAAPGGRSGREQASDAHCSRDGGGGTRAAAVISLRWAEMIRGIGE